MIHQAAILNVASRRSENTVLPGYQMLVTCHVDFNIAANVKYRISSSRWARVSDSRTDGQLLIENI